ncbi:hypothetical protein YPPY94_1172 [Yersinia pestis PY-94]|nr:hypothetical protein YPPY09_1210 [Yersinia pestis PY-09]EIR36177.1 hypothetical protein YPPY10_1228 [Yersinia pestis PY-10]EIR50704.1 hypothetical protein YPPY15_1164 [Yersinia pestis PY-15]EIR68252.1 hypothetical protein YPPY25_1202 [Yersinia pestis PY-25]EIS10141.1 hypothetical protein YPPY48_1196 [Yersinia pestis PY-48]EIS21311.1 hypothetical protein YPPY52_1205 [Yersinia pestis PY-52]EIS21878.1 hypothetical protein YPPY53_1219 [Yersinia pestis PY-53]EIT00246.1 hypothetical protein YPP
MTYIIEPDNLLPLYIISRVNARDNELSIGINDLNSRISQ